MENCSDFMASLSSDISESELIQRLHQEEQRENISKIPAFMYMSLLIILGVPGNIIVLLVYRTRFPSSTTKYFIMAMAAFDLCSCLIAMPFEIVDLRFDIQLDIPVFCKIMRFFVTLFAYGSILVLIGVAVDRFKRVCRPYSTQMSVKQSKRGIVIITIIAAIFSLPNLIFYGRQTIHIKGLTLVDCSIDDAFSQSMIPKLYFVFQGLCWFLAIISLSVMYGFIIFNIKKANKRRYRLDSRSYSDNNINTIDKTKVKSSKDLKIKQSASKKPSPKPSDKNNSKAMDTFTVKTHNKEDVRHMNSAGDSGDSKDNCATSSLTNKQNCGRLKIQRLFSRDVNPVGLTDSTSNNSMAREGAKEPLTLATIQDQDEDVPDTGLEITHEKSELGDGVSLQNLLTDEYCDEWYSEKGLVNACLDDESLDIHGTLHLSASEGNNLADDTSSLNNHHKILSESLQDLNAINPMSLDLTGFKNSPSSQRPQSCELVSVTRSGCEEAPSRQTKDGVGNDTTNKSAEESSANNPHRSKSLPVRQNSHPRGEENDTNSLPSGEGVNSRDGEETSKKYTHDPDKETIVSRNDNCDKGRAVDNADSNLESDRTSMYEMANQPQCLRFNTAKDDVHASDSAQKTTLTQNQGDSRQWQSNDTEKSSRISYSSQRRVSVCSNNDYNGNGHAKRKQTGMKELKTSKLAMMMFHVTLGFVLSYLPHLCIQIAKVLQSDTLDKLMCDSVFFGFYHVALRSIYLNHTLNPLIYGYYNRRFREYCRRLLVSPCQFLGRSSSNNTIGTQSFSMEHN